MLWHNRLGHTSLRVLDKVLHNIDDSITPRNVEFCSLVLLANLIVCSMVCQIIKQSNLLILFIQMYGVLLPCCPMKGIDITCTSWMTTHALHRSILYKLKLKLRLHLFTFTLWLRGCSKRNCFVYRKIRVESTKALYPFLTSLAYNLGTRVPMLITRMEELKGNIGTLWKLALLYCLKQAFH